MPPFPSGQHTKIRFQMAEINAFPCKVERKQLWKRMSEPQSRMATGTFSGHTHFGIKALKLCTSTHHLGSLHLRAVRAFPNWRPPVFYGRPCPSPGEEGLGVPGLLPNHPDSHRDSSQCFPDQICIRDNWAISVLEVSTWDWGEQDRSEKSPFCIDVTRQEEVTMLENTVLNNATSGIAPPSSSWDWLILERLVGPTYFPSSVSHDFWKVEGILKFLCHKEDNHE